MMGHHNDKVLARKAFGVMYTVPEIKPCGLKSRNRDVEAF